jgi:hypothetical protein
MLSTLTTVAGNSMRELLLRSRFAVRPDRDVVAAALLTVSVNVVPTGVAHQQAVVEAEQRRRVGVRRVTLLATVVV